MAKKTEPSLRSRALHYLARREHSRAELQTKLVRYAESDDEVTSLLDQLVEQGWLSDQRTVEQVVRLKRTRFGTQRIAHDLRSKGISENLIAETLPELKLSELDTAHEVWQKKFGVVAQDAKERARQIRFLQSRGFSLDVIFKLLKVTE